MSRFRGFLVANMLGALHPNAAWADTAGESVATALFEQAREDMRRGEVAAACPKFAESQRIDPSHGTLLNLFLCEEKLGKVASAWTHSKELVDGLPLKDDRRPIVERRLAALSARLPKLTIRLSSGAPPGAKILLDGVELGPSTLGIPIPIDPGAHKLTVVAAGRADRTSEISVQEASTQEWLGEAGPPTPSAPVSSAVSEPLKNDSKPAPLHEPPRPATAATHFDHSSSSSAPLPEWLGWTATGIGAAGLVAGAVMGAMTLNRSSTVDRVCPDKLCRDQSGLDAAREGKTLLVGTVASLAVGAVGLGFGIFVLTQSSAPAGAQNAPDLQHSEASSLKPTAAGITWARAF